MLIALLAVPALLVGSFLNTLIVRVPTVDKIFSPGPRCQECDASLGAVEVIPVLSWVLQRGRCKHCDVEIPVGYPLVEVGNVVLWSMAAVRFGLSWELPVYLAFFSLLLALSVIDIELYLLPNRLTYPAIVVSIVAVPVLSFLLREDPGHSIRSAYYGGLGYAGFLLFMTLFYEIIIRKEGMGMGDVKLALPLGIWVGWISLHLVVYAVTIATLLGSVVGLIIMLIRRDSRAFPFGPWLAIGAVAAIMYSEKILDGLNIVGAF